MKDEHGHPSTPKLQCATTPGDFIQANLSPGGKLIEIRTWDAHAVIDVWAAASLTYVDAHVLADWIKENVPRPGEAGD